MTIYTTSTEAGTLKDAIESQNKNSMLSTVMIPDDIKTLDGTAVRMSTYGIVDPIGRVMEPLYEAVMTPLERNSENSPMLINFVADQYFVMKSKFEERSNKNSPYGILRPHTAAVRGDIEYRNYIRDLVRVFIGQTYSRNRASMPTFLDFCRKFLGMVRRSGSDPIGGGLPITKTKYYTSARAPMGLSGLVVSFSDVPMNEKQHHLDNWFMDVNFGLYCSIAKEQGFFIDKKYPFRLIANLASEKMKISAEFYGADYMAADMGLIAFEEFYYNVSLLDFIELKNALFEGYNEFSNKNPFILSARPCRNRGIARTRTRREKLNLENRSVAPLARSGATEIENSYEPVKFGYGLHDERYSILFFLDLYIKVRYYEVMDRPGKVFSNQDLKNIYTEAKRILTKTGSVLEAFSLVEQKFRGFRLLAH